MNRINMNTKYVVLSGLGLAAAIPASELGAKTLESDTRPNVVIFFTDDQGTVDVNRFGAKDLSTPNMDRLCRTGVMMTRFYANSSISSPSRAALLTGRYPQRAGMPALAPPDPSKQGLPKSETTIADILRSNGYSTAIIGKWHLGFHSESLPGAHGFDYSFGHLGGCIDNYSHFFYWNGPNRHDLYRNGNEVWYEGENFAELMTRESLDFIERNKNTPFFLFFSSNYPHYPLQGDAKWREYYKETPSPRDKYAAMVSTIDEKIGIIVDKLEQEGLRDNTIIIFMSDNGHSTEDRTFGGGGSAGIFRGAKFSVYEGGIRVPAIISYPACVPSDVVCDQVGAGFDWLPTIMDFCGLPAPEHKLDGKSLVSVITGQSPTPHDILNWEVGKSWAVVEGDFKLVGSKEANVKPELYNLSADPGESNNLYELYPEMVTKLEAEHTRWVEDVKNP
jgi:arylsulfatase A-like enzyme